MKKIEDLKLIALDLDGTLLDSNSKISSITKDVLNKLLDQGYEIVIATGRNYNEARRLTNEINDFHYITNNGSSLIDKNENILYEKYFPNDLLENIMGIFNNVKDLNCAFYTKNEIIVEEKEKFYKEYIKLYKKHVPKEDFVIDDVYKELNAKKINVIPDANKKIIELDKNIQKLYFSGEKKPLKLFKTRLLENINNNLNIFNTGVNLEINLSKISKGSALEELTNELNISLSETIAFGDSGNDIDLLETSEISVVMENTNFEDLKEKADIIAPPNNEDGVAKVLSELLK